MAKIKDYNKNDSIQDIKLIVLESTIKVTKTNKEYINMKLFDGETTVSCNVWDYNPNKFMPKKYDVLMCSGTLDTWEGILQLNNLKYYLTNGDITDFSPQSNFDIDKYESYLHEFMTDIANETLRTLVFDLIIDNKENFNTLPAGMHMHHAYVGGLLKHTVDTTNLALNIARTIPGANMDLILAGTVLHDIGKVKTYKIELEPEITDLGRLHNHIVDGCCMLEKYRNDENTRFVDIIQHLIASHHGKLEYGSPVLPQILEAFIIYQADYINSHVEMIVEAENKVSEDADLTNKVYGLNNYPIFTRTYINKLFEKEDE